MKAFKQMRDGVQQLVYRLIDPSVRGMIRLGVTPNMVTTAGFLGNLLAAILLVYSAFANPAAPCLWQVGLCGALILFSSIFDMVDGYLARTGGLASTFGAFYDSVLDRYSELVTLLAIAYYFISYGQMWFALATFLSLVGSIMVSYVRARAEGLGAECKVGLMQRPERVVVTSLGAILAPLFASLWSLAIPQILIALLANYTAFVRVSHVRGQLK